jgi:hypothetical protein
VPDVRLRVGGDESLRRRRLSVLLRLLLVVPYAVVLTVWSLLAAPALVVAWIAALLRGRVPVRLHAFLSSYLRYETQLTAWFEVLSAQRPRPLRTRSHPFRVEIPERPPAQARLVTLFRPLLALPASVIASVLYVVLVSSAVPAWFAGVILGRTTAGLQELGTFCLRYVVETRAYVLLLTPAYPRLAPPPVREARE